MSAANNQGLFASLGGVEFIWLLVSGAGGFVLVVESAALLTLWRRPSRVRNVGLVSLGAASLMFCVASLALFLWHPIGAYADSAMWIVNMCYFHVQVPYRECTASAADQHSAALVIALSLLAIVSLTSACVVWALRLMAREPRPPLGTVWLALVRLLLAFIGALVCAFGVAVAVIGVLLIIDNLVNSRLYQADTDSIVRYSLDFSALGVVVGGLVALVGALVLWLSGLRRRATASTSSTLILRGSDDDKQATE